MRAQAWWAAWGHRVRWSAKSAACAAVVGAFASAPVASTVEAEPPVMHGEGLARRKGATGDDASTAPLLATLAQTHTGERVLLDATSPPASRFDALLADRATGASIALDPRLLGLLRTLAGVFTRDGAPPRIELVSGFRSPKLNEMLRKKGHHVASHSQHSLGHAVDFRIVPAGEAKGVDPRALADAVRAAGWSGGVGVYRLESDWFVHADVGPRRAW